MAVCFAVDELLCSSDETDEMYYLLASCARDDHVKVSNFMEEVAPRMTDTLFRRTFRVPRGVFRYLLDTLDLDDDHVGGREAVSAEKKIGMFLRYVGTKSTVFEVAQLFNVTDSTFIKARRQVQTSILDNLLPLHITWPQPIELHDIAQAVDGMGNDQHQFSDIVGFVDGTHIPIWRPRVPNADAYFNRKKYFSVSVQGVCREDLRFTYVDVGSPGRMHDARALRSSDLWDSGYAKCLQGRYHLLGDAAYPLTPWLITPYRNTGNLTPRQVLFNEVHASKRVTIERCFGVLKQRFAVLRHRVDLVDMNEINELILAVCVLHNLCIVHRDQLEFPDEDDKDPNHPQFPQPPLVIVPNDAAQSVEGRLKRITMTNRL